MKILIIEDEYNLADAISSMLKSQKYTVEIKTDGEKGLEEALTDIYDLIIFNSRFNFNAFYTNMI